MLFLVSAKLSLSVSPNLQFGNVGKNPFNGNTILWTDGIVPPDMESFVDVYKGTSLEEDYSEYVCPYLKDGQTNGKYWYDIDKDSTDPMCFAHAAGNIVSWWVSQNKDEITKYVDEKIQSGDTEQLGGKLINLRDFHKLIFPLTETQLQFESKIFQRIYGTFRSATTEKGGRFDRVVDWFLNGYEAQPIGDRNKPSEFKPSSSGGFMYGILGKELATDRYMTIMPYEIFNEKIKYNLLTQKGMSISFQLALTGHAITFWGAEFDDKDNVVAVYITDSDDFVMFLPDTKIPYGMKRHDITKSKSGYAVINTLKKGSDHPEVSAIYAVDLSKQKFEDYWANKLSAPRHYIKFEENKFAKTYSSLTYSRANNEIKISAILLYGALFDGWEVLEGDVEIKDNKFIMGDKDVLIRVKYTTDNPDFKPPAVWKVTFNPGKGGSGEMETLEFFHKDSFSPPVQCGFIPPYGYVFSHWSGKAGNIEFKDFTNQEIIIDTNLELIANWKLCNHEAERVFVKRVEPTETTSGVLEHWVCPLCGMCFTQKEGGYELGENDIIIQPSKGPSLSAINAEGYILTPDFSSSNK